MDVDVLIDTLVKLGWSFFSSSNLQIYVFIVSWEFNTSHLQTMTYLIDSNH